MHVSPETRLAMMTELAAALISNLDSAKSITAQAQGRRCKPEAQLAVFAADAVDALIAECDKRYILPESLKPAPPPPPPPFPQIGTYGNGKRITPDLAEIKPARK